MIYNKGGTAGKWKIGTGTIIYPYENSVAQGRESFLQVSKSSNKKGKDKSD